MPARALLALAVCAGTAFAHGESSRTPPPPTVGPQVVPTKGPTTTPRGQRGETAPATRADEGWEAWWAYNLEHILAQRLRSAPVSGSRTSDNDRVVRERLREGRLFDLMLEALEDKSHYVRASAAVALGKFGVEQANRFLERHSAYPGEGWFDVRESALYGMGILARTENRALMTAIAGDKDRPILERSMSLVSLLMDGSEDSLAVLKWHLDYKHSGIRAAPGAAPVRAEEERRRLCAHLLGFSRAAGLDEYLFRVAQGSQRWGAAEQGLAVTALGRRGARDYVEPLFRMMGMRGLEEVVQQSVPLALGMLIRPDEEDRIGRLAAFVRLYRRDDVVRRFTLMALADIGGAHAAGQLFTIHRDNVFNEDTGRGFLHLAMGRLAGDVPGLRDVLMREFDGASTDSARASLALALGLARAKEAVPLTIRYLERSGLPGAEAGGPSMLVHGPLALGLMGDAASVPVVRGILRKYAHAGVRRNAAMALALLLRREAVPELVELLFEAGDPYAKAAAVTALGLLPEPDEKAVTALVRAYRDDGMDDTVRAMAIVALGALGDPRAIPLSATFTRGYNYLIRCLALDEIASYL